MLWYLWYGWVGENFLWPREGTSRKKFKMSYFFYFILYFTTFTLWVKIKWRSSDWFLFLCICGWFPCMEVYVPSAYLGPSEAREGFWFLLSKTQSLISSSEPSLQTLFKAPEVGAGDVAQWLECILLFQAQFSAPRLGGSVTCNSCSKVSKASGLCGYYIHVHRHRYLLITESYKSKFFRTSLAKDFSYL